MNNDPLKQLSIRAGVVRQEDIGYILACDPKKEENVPHVKIFKWHGGKFSESWANFNAHTVCLITDPDLALIFMSLNGNYAIHSEKSVAGNIFNNSYPPPKQPRYGDIRSISEIGGKAYAVGFEGMVYRLDDLTKWTRIDEDLLRIFDIEAIHGFDAADIYAVGYRGELWHFNSKTWTKHELPTNAYLTTVKCTGDGTVYIAGHGGILIRGREHMWEIIDHKETIDDLWDLEWFEGELYISTMSNVYQLKKDGLELVNFGDNPPKSCYQLSSAKGVMWSIGEKDIMSFDGKKWTRIV